MTDPTIETGTKQYDLHCHQCNKPLSAIKRRRELHDKGIPFYCSRACQMLGSKITLECSVCHASFQRAKSRPVPTKPFCSTECRNKGNGRQRTGTTAPCDNPSCDVPVYRKVAQIRDADHRFCSRRCKHEWMTGREMVERPERPCGHCGATMRLSPDDVAHDKKFCSPTCHYANMRAQPGYRYIEPKTGYAWLHTEAGDRVQEHRYVMEQHLGRPLLPTETVHHKTGGFKGRSNNDLANLELWTGNHPTGHRVEDVVDYCREMLALYGTEDERARYATPA